MLRLLPKWVSNQILHYIENIELGFTKHPNYCGRVDGCKILFINFIVLVNCKRDSQLSLCSKAHKGYKNYT